ncbi:hypothetical protein Y032_0572g145 [Ancylostoma ceylanicum]|uniref:Uncharacterized protein n=1 Tax=Ancylostoma ceylanicum TaxID=53326 RepID=A0A016WNX5_9BILA|nr:hypothetical protein Y032_0572g145 [Ancylostoma ceylanicum]
MNSKRSYRRGGTAARALWLSAASPEAGDQSVSVSLRVSIQQPHRLNAEDNQSARAAVPPLDYGRLEFTLCNQQSAVCSSSFPVNQSFLDWLEARGALNEFRV